MLEHSREAGAPGRHWSAWSLGPFVVVALVLGLGALHTGSATALTETDGFGGRTETAAAESDAYGGQVPPFENSAVSIDELGREIVRALDRGDEGALERFRLTEQEHNHVVWPELPASAPEINYPVDYAWTNIENRNRRATARNLATFSGRSVSAHAVECRGPGQEFETFRVRTDCYVVFTVNGSLERWQSQLFKDVIERGGRYKIFRYYDAEPEPYTSPQLAGVS